MKILQLGKFYPVRGGVEKVMYDLTSGLSSRGIECDMLCAAYKGGGHIININGKGRVICCRTWKRISGTMISPGIVYRMMRICRHYDIVHIHHPDPMACLALYCSGYKGKVILHWHSDIIKQKSLLKFYRPLQKWLIQRSDLILGTTPVYLEKSPYLKGVAAKSCMPIGVPRLPSVPDRERALQAGYPGKKIIFSLGRLVPYKGFEYLIRAALSLPDGYIVLIGGDGPLRYELESSIGTWNANDRVKLLGRIPEEDLPAYYHACTLFCLPSVQKTEAFGIVQIEAMSCGKPVVATDIPGSGVPWVNEHGVTGLNVPPGDPELLARAILEITKDEETYRRYSQNAYRRYSSVFTAEGMIDKAVKYYEQVKTN